MIDYEKTPAGGIELTAGGMISKDDITRIWARLQDDMAGAGKVKLLETVREIEGVAPAAIWEDLRRGLPMMHRVSHAAIVTDQRWIAVATKVAGHFVSAEVRTFALGEIDAARSWLAAA